MFKKIIVFIAAIFAVSFFYWHNLDSPADKNGQKQLFLVDQGETAKQVAENLRKESLIKSVFYFNYMVKQSGLNIKAGEYSISPALSTKEIIKMLTQGEAINKDKLIKIIEGWDSEDINDYLNKNKIVPENTFIDIAKQPIKNLKFRSGLNKDLINDLPPTATLEGFLFPDTYRIDNAAVAEDIINKMLANFDKKLNLEMREEIKRRQKTVYEIVIMASIIEKEVRTEDDMKIISGIFWDRIKYGTPLQVDASLSYILDDKISAHTIADLRIDSPYNTYRYRGLPPGPITNPGLKAIKAAIYPTPTEYVYFLSDPATGRTVYSKTLEEHNKNKAKYLK